MKTILTNCTVIDCTGEPPRQDMTIVVEGDKIAGLKPGVYSQAAGEGERVFDLEGGYVLPGLWDCHVHLSGLMPDPKHLTAGESVADRTIRAGRNALDALRAGITAIRVVGEGDFIDVAWKRAFDAGIFVGPRIFACGRAITATAGHGSGHPLTVEIDGADEAQKAVREQLKGGVDQIKIMADQLTPAEVEAVTEVAHLQKTKREMLEGKREPGEKGKRVSADCNDPKKSILGGVDCIEHGVDTDDEAIAMMLERDVFYDPTLAVLQDGTFMSEIGFDKFHPGRVLVAKTGGVPNPEQKRHVDSFQRALKAGVKITCGSDANPTAYFALLEVEHLVRAGMTEMEALIAATRTSADLCEVVDQLGTVEEGKLADLVVLSANPLEDISNIRELKLVFKGGNLVETKEPEGQADFWELFYL